MNLVEKQKRFSQLLAKFILDLRERGYESTFGETYRPEATARYYASRGLGIDNSLHCLRLAVDLNLWSSRGILKTVEDYRPAGELWESYSDADSRCCWGGRWGDGDHFSLEHNGVR